MNFEALTCFKGVHDDFLDDDAFIILDKNRLNESVQDSDMEQLKELSELAKDQLEDEK